MPYHERPFAAVSPTLRSTLQKSSTNLIVNSSPRSSILVIVYGISPSPSKNPWTLPEKDNTPFNYPILNSCSLKTVSSTDAYLSLDDCILHSPMCSLNFVHIVRIVRVTLHFILCNRFYVLLLHSICNSVRMTCLNKKATYLILSYLICRLMWDYESET